MRLAHPVLEKIGQYGSMTFQHTVQEHIKKIFEGIDVGAVDFARVYHQYVYAYVLATKLNNFEQLLDNTCGTTDLSDPGCMQSPVIESVPVFSLVDGNTQVGFALESDGYPANPVTGVTFLEVVVLEHEYVTVISRLSVIFQQELLSQTGLVSIINSMLPGVFVDYCGEDLSTLVIETEADFSL